MYRFLAVIEKANGNYSAYSPDLPGCVATGKTREDAERNMREAMLMHVEGRISHNRSPIPLSLSADLVFGIDIGLLFDERVYL